METCNGRSFAAAIADNPITIWNASDGSLSCKLPGQNTKGRVVKKYATSGRFRDTGWVKLHCTIQDYFALFFSVEQDQDLQRNERSSTKILPMLLSILSVTATGFVKFQGTFADSKLRSDLFNGSVSSLRILCHNRLLLLGSSNGLIHLLC